MQRTSTNPRNTQKSISTKVTPAVYAAVIAAAGDKKPGVWVRDLIEATLTSEPMLRVLLEEQLAANYIQESLLHAIAAGTKPTVETTRQLIATAHRKKAALADAALGDTSRRTA